MLAYFENEREKMELSLSENEHYKGFADHFHDNVEILLVLSGELISNINGTQTIVQGNSIVFVDSYDTHGFSVYNNHTHIMSIVIPYRHLSKFNHYKGNKEIVNPVICNKELVDKLVTVFRIIQNGTILQQESGSDLFLFLILEHLQLKETKKKEEKTILKQLLNYIHKNYTENISLSKIAKNLGYSESHLSRIFNKFSNVTISNYINKLRFQEVERLTTLGNKKKIDCILESGFQSLQAYYFYKKNRQ